MLGNVRAHRAQQKPGETAALAAIGTYRHDLLLSIDQIRYPNDHSACTAPGLPAKQSTIEAYGCAVAIW